MEADFIGKQALQRIRVEGVKRKQVGLRIDCPRLAGPNPTFWPVSKGGETIGKVTSAVYSPRLEQNIALAMVTADCADIGTVVEVSTSSGAAPAQIVEKPFFDPRKRLAAG